MKYNYCKLRGKIKEVFGTQDKYAEALNLSKTSVSSKLNNIVDFSQTEIYTSAKILDITSEEIGEYFFNYKVEKKSTKNAT